MRRVTKGAEGRGGEEEIQVGSARNSPLPGWANQDSSAVNRHMLHIQISVNCTAQTNITPEGEVGRRMWKTRRTHPYIYITLSWFAGLLLLIRFFAPSRCIYLCLHPVVTFSDSVIMRGKLPLDRLAALFPSDRTEILRYRLSLHLASSVLPAYNSHRIKPPKNMNLFIICWPTCWWKSVEFFCRPSNIPGASRQSSIAAFSSKNSSRLQGLVLERDQKHWE